MAELRAKEQQMEARISDARSEAASIREAALKSAREIKARGLADIDEELKRVAEEKINLMKDEAARIEDEGRNDAAALKALGEKNFEKVVEEVMRFVREPHGADL